MLFISLMDDKIKRKVTNMALRTLLHEPDSRLRKVSLSIQKVDQRSVRFVG